MFFARSHNQWLLRRLATDLAGWPVQHIDDHLRLKLNPQQSVIISLSKQSLFLATIHSSRFKVQGTTQLQTPGVITAHQPGWIRRYPVSFRARRNKHIQTLINFLNSFITLRQTVAQLDYRHFQLHIESGHWYCEIEPWAASQLISHLPPLHRYLRLLPQQRILLLSTLSMLHDAMERFDKLHHPVNH